MKRIYSLLGIAMLSVATMAQNTMTVHKTDNTKVAVYLDEFQNLTFGTDAANAPALIVNKKDNTQITVPLSDFNHTSFDLTIYRYGNQCISDKEQEVTEYIVSKLTNFEDNATTYGDIYHRAYFDFNEVGYYMQSIQSLSTFLSRIQADYPQCFQIYSIPRYDYGTGQYYARIFKAWTPEKFTQTMADIDATVEDIIKDFTPAMTDYEKVRLMHDRFLRDTHYGGMNDANGGNIVGGFVNKRAVCEGLSRSWLYLCQKAGLKCIYISGAQFNGMTTDPDTGTETENLTNHAWNYTMVDGKWYLMDLADDGGFNGVIGHNGFLRGVAWLNKGYRLYSNDGRNPNSYYTSLPALSEEDYNCDRSAIYF